MRVRTVAIIAVGLLFSAATANATTVSLTAAQVGPVLIDFGAVQTLAPVNGQVIGGVTFGFTIAGNPSNDAIIDSGPGNTNNITVANVEGNTLGVLSMLFPSDEFRLGFGYAISVGAPVPNAVQVNLFDAANVLVGSISFNAALDPVFAGGFAGLGSDIAFRRAEVNFADPVAGSRFAFDNVRFSAQPTAVPEPGTMLLVGTGVAAAARRFRRARRSSAS